MTAKLSNPHRFSYLIALLFITSCGVSYSLLPSIIHIEISPSQSKSEIIETVSRYLIEEDFIDYGVSEEMISLINQTQDSPGGKVIESLEIRNTFLNKKAGLSVYLKDCSDLGTKLRQCSNYGRETDEEISNIPVIELNVTESRPGGFSKGGLMFNEMLLENLSSRFSNVIQILNPPPTDEEEYRSITIQNSISLVVVWVASFLISSYLFGLIFMIMVRKLGFSKKASSAVFVPINTFLSAPMPMQAATLYVAYLPNIIVDWNLEYYSKFGWYVPTSFFVAFLGSILLSFLPFRDKSSNKNSNKSEGFAAD